MKLWKFDKEVAANFVNHASQHIPNYHDVIDQCIDVCNSYDDKSIKIIDVGCATGETINRLHINGFRNLYGVDNSQDMLEQCPHAATYYLSDKFPKGNFDVILVNWTLHFIEDKVSYLQSAYECLNENGVLIISDKISKDPKAIRFYHNLKRKNGVSEKDIAEKESQVEDIMFINNLDWYKDILRSTGFKSNNIHIINAYWCFATIAAFKEM